MILIIDFGSQTTHLIGRRIRDFGVEVEIIDPERALSQVKAKKPSGIILSGGPSSVYEKNAPTINQGIFELNIPILGICYGWQLTAKKMGGSVIQGKREYGPTEVKRIGTSPLLENIKANEFKVWMSHGDEVVKLPVGFQYHLSTPSIKAAGVGNVDKKIFGVQFHPEVEHTQHGNTMLRNFVETICGETIALRKIKVEDVIEAVKAQIDAKGENAKVIAAVSGGVDSSVASAIVAKAVGKRFIPVYCDNGLMRVGTKDNIEYIFAKLLGVKPVILDCKKEFLSVLKGVTSPEKKRVNIGKKYIELFEREAKKRDDIAFLLQGTIYSDVIESKGTKHASKIKSHHNVGGLPKEMKLDLIEPVRNFYKDEVIELGRQLGLPDSVLDQQPFPGPGQAIRILGEVTEKRLQKQHQADQIVLEVLKKSGWYAKVFQSFPIMTGALSTAVQGDGRTYGEVVGLRIYDSSDIMTAGWTHLPYDILQEISSSIANEVPDVSRVVYDITTKPPATMEWE